MKLRELYEAACSELSDNKIDGVFIGEPSNLLSRSLRILKPGWGLLLVGELTEKNDYFTSQSAFHYVLVSEGNIESVKMLANRAKDLEILVIFNVSNNPVLIIEDFPEDISVSTEVLN